MGTFLAGGLVSGVWVVAATAQKINLPNTYPIWASSDLFESYWSTNYEYFNFLFLLSILAVILRKFDCKWLPQ